MNKDYAVSRDHLRMNARKVEEQAHVARLRGDLRMAGELSQRARDLTAAAQR